ncbi:hypothetical protein THAOC_05594, partial [Thalassiosira oceanica]
GRPPREEADLRAGDTTVRPEVPRRAGRRRGRLGRGHQRRDDAAQAREGAGGDEDQNRRGVGEEVGVREEEGG